jgi:dipeptidyl aminopeptidase/acylaminoacyl peptidase
VIRGGLVDAERTAVIGHSYGGYLAAWALTQTRVFRTGVVLSGVADWLSFGQTSNLGGGYDPLFHPDADRGSAPGRESLIARSPAHQTHRGAAPLLIIHGLEDRVTPIGQAEQLYNAWTAAENLAELVVYPHEGHELVDPGHRRDAARRVVSWLTTHGVLTGEFDRDMSA